MTTLGEASTPAGEWDDSRLYIRPPTERKNARLEPEPCPFCGRKPRVELGKKGHCSLHGEPFQPALIRCTTTDCPAKPQVQAGDVFNGGLAQATNEAIAKWNTRAPIATTPTNDVSIEKASRS
jgi:hypothetical protein